jgi:hypothetical protein
MRRRKPLVALAELAVVVAVTRLRGHDAPAIRPPPMAEVRPDRPRSTAG